MIFFYSAAHKSATFRPTNRAAVGRTFYFFDEQVRARLRRDDHPARDVLPKIAPWINDAQNHGPTMPK